MISKKRIERILLSLFTILILLVAGGVIYLLLLHPEGYFPATDPLKRVDVLVAALALLANVGLTVGLLYIYLNQNRTLQKEIEVLQDQQILMRAERKPEVDTPYNVQIFGEEDENIAPKNEGEEENDIIEQNVAPPENGIRFQLANNGEGLARNFRLLTRLIVREGKHKNGGTYSSVRRLDRYALNEYADNTLQGKERDVTFQSEPQLLIHEILEEGEEHPPYSTYSFSEGIRKLAEEGTTEIEIILELQYEDVFGEQYEDQFLTRSAGITADMDWVDINKAENILKTWVNSSAEGKSVVMKEDDSLWQRLRNLIPN